MRFQQDNVIFHAALETLELVLDKLLDSVIFSFRYVESPACVKNPTTCKLNEEIQRNSVTYCHHFLTIEIVNFMKLFSS